MMDLQWSSDAWGSVQNKRHILSMQHFANGYWLGEMLSKLNLQPDFDHFEDRRTPDAMLKNYARLQVCGAALHMCLFPISQASVTDCATVCCCRQDMHMALPMQCLKRSSPNTALCCSQPSQSCMSPSPLRQLSS